MLDKRRRQSAVLHGVYENKVNGIEKPLSVSQHRAEGGTPAKPNFAKLCTKAHCAQLVGRGPTRRSWGAFVVC